MPRLPTNTLIITRAPDNLLEDPSDLMRYLAKYNLNCELISLSRFGRILLICDTAEISQEIYKLLKQASEWKHLYITFSIQDNELTLGFEVEHRMDYLPLPSEDGSKRFLISPPLSPPPEWDHWDKVEERPHTQPISNPDELSHLLWERLGGIDSSQFQKLTAKEPKRDLNIEPQVLFEDVDNGVPVIVLDKADNSDPDSQPNKPVVKTSLPPLL